MREKGQAYKGQCKHKSILGRCSVMVVVDCKYCGKPYCGLHRDEHEAKCCLRRKGE